MLWIATLALAHVPHDQVIATYVPPDLSDAEPWIVLVEPGSTQQVFRSDDGGHTWYGVFFDPTAEKLVGGGRAGDGSLLFASSSTLWHSADFGETWTETAFPPGAMDMAVGDDAAWFAANTGLYSLVPGGTPVLEVATPIASVEAVGDDVAALDTNGDVWTRDGAAFVERARPGNLPFSAVSPDGGYAGNAQGTVYAWGGTGWSRCGALPVYQTAGVRQNVLRLRVEDEYLIALTASGGPAVSTDGCATWKDVTAPEQPVHAAARGGVRRLAQAFTTVDAFGSHWLIGGWMGLYETLDAGVSWRDTEPMGPDISNLPAAARETPATAPGTR